MNSLCKIEGNWFYVRSVSFLLHKNGWQTEPDGKENWPAFFNLLPFGSCFSISVFGWEWGYQQMWQESYVRIRRNNKQGAITHPYVMLWKFVRTLSYSKPEVPDSRSFTTATDLVLMLFILTFPLCTHHVSLLTSSSTSFHYLSSLKLCIVTESFDILGFLLMQPHLKIFYSVQLKGKKVCSLFAVP